VLVHCHSSLLSSAKQTPGCEEKNFLPYPSGTLGQMMFASETTSCVHGVVRWIILWGAAAAAAAESLGESRWYWRGHHALVDLAVKQLELFPAEQEVIDFNRFWASNDFQAGVYSGLLAPDGPLIGPYSGVVYSSHFYDPDSGRNFIGLGSLGFPSAGFLGFFGMNAKTQGQKYMDAAVHCGRLVATKLSNTSQTVNATAAEFFNCGFLLGVSLHYETDLVQPMHAANFGNLFGGGVFWLLSLWDYRHQDYEVMVDDLVVQGYLDDTPDVVDYTQITSVGITSASDLLQDTAVRSKAVWVHDMKPHLPSAFLWFVGHWDLQYVKHSVDITMKDYGYKNTAKYLAFFGHEVFGP
jgi:hypothetical protein